MPQHTQTHKHTHQTHHDHRQHHDHNDTLHTQERERASGDVEDEASGQVTACPTGGFHGHLDQERGGQDQEEPGRDGQGPTSLGETEGTLRRREGASGKLKAELAKEPIGVPTGDPMASGAGNGVDALMEDSEETLRDKELELRRMAAAKADANGEERSAKRVQEISKIAEGISKSKKKRKCKRENSKEGEHSCLRHGLVEPGGDSGRRDGHIRHTCKPSHDVGCDGNSGRLPKARGLAVERARALHGTTVEGEFEVPQFCSFTKDGQVSRLIWMVAKMAGNHVMEMRDDPSSTSATQQMQYQRLLRHFVRNQNFLGEAP